jgi:hypothetical protein
VWRRAAAGPQAAWRLPAWRRCQRRLRRRMWRRRIEVGIAAVASDTQDRQRPAMPNCGSSKRTPPQARGGRPRSSCSAPRCCPPASGSRAPRRAAPAACVRRRHPAPRPGGGRSWASRGRRSSSTSCRRPRAQRTSLPSCAGGHAKCMPRTRAGAVVEGRAGLLDLQVDAGLRQRLPAPQAREVAALVGAGARCAPAGQPAMGSGADLHACGSPAGSPAVRCRPRSAPGWPARGRLPCAACVPLRHPVQRLPGVGSAQRQPRPARGLAAVQPQLVLFGRRVAGRLPGRLSPASGAPRLRPPGPR